MWTWMWWKSTAEQEHTVQLWWSRGFFLLRVLFSPCLSLLLSLHHHERTQTQCVLCLPGSFYSSSFVVEKHAEGRIATAITPVFACERGRSPVFTFLLITVYSGKAAERLTFALRSLSATVWPPFNKRGFASSKMLRLWIWIRPHADHFHEFSYICLNCVSFLKKSDSCLVACTVA